MGIYVAHLVDRWNRSRYVEYVDLIIDVITIPCPDCWSRGTPPARFVRTDPPEHDDMGFPIFREQPMGRVVMR